jgi:hypothetical protein
VVVDPCRQPPMNDGGSGFDGADGCRIHGGIPGRGKGYTTV